MKCVRCKKQTKNAKQYEMQHTKIYLCSDCTYGLLQEWGVASNKIE